MHLYIDETSCNQTGLAAHASNCEQLHQNNAAVKTPPRPRIHLLVWSKDRSWVYRYAFLKNRENHQGCNCLKKSLLDYMLSRECWVYADQQRLRKQSKPLLVQQMNSISALVYGTFQALTVSAKCTVHNFSWINVVCRLCLVAPSSNGPKVPGQMLSHFTWEQVRILKGKALRCGKISCLCPRVPFSTESVIQALIERGNDMEEVMIWKNGFVLFWEELFLCFYAGDGYRVRASLASMGSAEELPFSIH